MTGTPAVAMIFAAGFGTRMMPLTKDVPKPMIEVGGVPLIDRTLTLAREAGITRIVANAHYKADVLSAHLDGSGVDVLYETPEILDTGGGLKNALPRLGSGPVFTLNSDVVWRGPNPLRHLLDHWRPDDMDALLLCVDPARAHGRQGGGDFAITEDGVVSRGGPQIFGGVQIIKTERLEEIDEAVFSLNRLWDLMISDKRCFGVVYPGVWCDVGRPDGIGLAEAVLEGRDDV